VAVKSSACVKTISPAPAVVMARFVPDVGAKVIAPESANVAISAVTSLIEKSPWNQGRL
jgi:hypothetical protein